MFVTVRPRPSGVFPLNDLTSYDHNSLLANGFGAEGYDRICYVGLCMFRALSLFQMPLYVGLCTSFWYTKMNTAVRLREFTTDRK